jgi:hypothetical protein
MAQPFGAVIKRLFNRIERAEVETAVGFLVGAGTPWFAWAVVRELYPALPAVEKIDSDLWEFLLLRLFALGVFINAGLFFAALWAQREGMAMGLLVASILYVIGVGYWRWEYL